MVTTIKKVALEQVWQLRHEVMWPDMPFDYIKIEDDDEGIHFGLLKDNKLISVVSLFINGEDAQFRKFATLEREQGKGYGSTLLNYVIDNARQFGVKRIWCNARTNKTDFYHKFGLTETDATFTRGGKAYVIMEKIL